MENSTSCIPDCCDLSAEIIAESLHSVGIQVAHVISSVAQAQFAESCNIDAIIAEGLEAGGRLGREEIPLFSLIPQVVDAVSRRH